MRHRGLISAAFLLTLAFQTADTRAVSKVLFSDDFEQHAIRTQLGTHKPNVLVELVPELATDDEEEEQLLQDVVPAGARG